MGLFKQEKEEETIQIGIRMPRNLLSKVEEMAKKKMSNVSQVIREATQIGLGSMK